jgi:hypothetical protein
LVPSRQRFPPQIVAPTATQSVFDVHGTAAAWLHVLQKHFDPPNPGAEQEGLAADSVFVTVLVVYENSIGVLAMSVDPEGGQSRLVSPNTAVGEIPLASQLRPLRMPPAHVPLLTSSLRTSSPTHVGQG